MAYWTHLCYDIARDLHVMRAESEECVKRGDTAKVLDDDNAETARDKLNRQLRDVSTEEEALEEEYEDWGWRDDLPCSTRRFQRRSVDEVDAKGSNVVHIETEFETDDSNDEAFDSTDDDDEEEEENDGVIIHPYVAFLHREKTKNYEEETCPDLNRLYDYDSLLGWRKHPHIDTGLGVLYTGHAGDSKNV